MPYLAKVNSVIDFLRSEIPTQDVSSNPVVVHPHNTSRAIPERLPAEVVKKLSALEPARAIAATAWQWSAIATAIALCTLFWHPLLCAIAVMFIGARQHALIIMDTMHRITATCQSVGIPQFADGAFELQSRQISTTLNGGSMPSLSRRLTMKTLIYSMAVAVLTCIAASGFTPARATTTAPNLQPYEGSSLSPVHCRRTYHCHWTVIDAVRTRHCHVCG
jgi:hypothetical protein